MPWYEPAGTPEGRNVRSLYQETAWFGILSGIAATFVSVFALRLGATTAQVGWLAALPALVNIVWLIPAARIIERQRDRLSLAVLCGYAQRLGYLAIALMPFLLTRGRVEALIVLNTLLTVPTAVINTAVTAAIPDLVSPDRRGEVVRVRWLILSLLTTAAVLLGGRFLDLVPVPLNYQILLGGGALLSVIGLPYLRRIRLRDAVGLPRLAQSVRRERGSTGGPGLMVRLRRGLAGVLANRDFVRFVLAASVFHWGLYLPAALWSVIRVRDLKATDTWIGLIAVVIDASMIAGYFYWGKVQARRGDRGLLIITAVLVSLYTLFTAVVPSIQWMIPTSILGGLSWAGCNLALFNVMLSVCPAERRATYIALYTALLNITAFAGPLLGAALAGWIGIRNVFLVSAAVRAVGAVLFLVLPRR